MLLAQAAGRLIRTTTDRGVVAVLDRRLGSGPLPLGDRQGAAADAQRTRDRADVEAFLATLDA